MTLDQLPRDAAATITAIDWTTLDPREARRLRELGFDKGVTVTVQHRGVLFWRDPLAVRVGRMTVALRRAHAAVMEVSAA